MPPRGVRAAAWAVAQNPLPKTPGPTSESIAIPLVNLAEDSFTDIPFGLELIPRKRSRTEASSSSAMAAVAAMAWEAAFIPPPPPSPPLVVVEAGPNHGADSEETHEVQAASDLSLWLSSDSTTPPVTNPRELLLNIPVDRRESHIDRTYMHLFRASNVLADYKLLLKDYQALQMQSQAAFEENESLKNRVGQAESLEAELGGAKEENQRLTQKLEDSENACCRARNARYAAETKLEEEQKKVADALAWVVAAEERVRTLDETSWAAEECAIVAEERNASLQSEVRKLKDECQWMQNEQTGVVEDTWTNCLSQLHFFYPHLRFDASKISPLWYIKDGVVMKL